MNNSKHTVAFDDEQIFKLKQYLKKIGKKPTVQNVVDFSLELTLNSLRYLDEDTLDIIKPNIR